MKIIFLKIRAITDLWIISVLFFRQNISLGVTELIF